MEADGFLQLREQYVSKTLESLATTSAVLHSISSKSATDSALQHIRTFFHDVARSARTYGFPQATVLALQGEYDCDLLIRRKQPPTKTDVDKWNSFLEALAREFTQQQPPATFQEIASHRVFQVLIVDDDQGSATELEELLRKRDMLVRRAKTKEEAIRILTDGMMEAIITDILLPDGLGYELVEHIRALPEGEKPVVLIVSVLGGFLDKVEAIRSGADGYFEKPVDLEALMERLLILLERNRARDVRILCVEDDPTQALYLDTVLSLGSYQVKIVDDPKDFEESLASFQPDAVLIDYQFPRFSSYQVARYLRQDDRYAFLPIILMTEGELDPLDVDKLAGDVFLRKPVAPNTLLNSIAAHIERSRLLKSHLNRDGLTRLLTHTAFVEQANTIIAKKRRKSESPCALVVLDMDHFQAINTKYGYPAGDRVLVSVAGFLRRRIRQSDLKSRFGGQVFAIVIDDIGKPEAVSLLSRLLDEFAQIPQHAPDGSMFYATFSAGVAVLEARTMDFELWYQAAKDALLNAKKSGRRAVLPA